MDEGRLYHEMGALRLRSRVTHWLTLRPPGGDAHRSIGYDDDGDLPSISRVAVRELALASTAQQQATRRKA